MAHQAAVTTLKPYFRFPVRDREATGRFLVGGGLFLVSLFLPVLPALFAIGYCVQVMRRGAQGEAPSMHAWADWGALLRDGFRACVVSFVFFLPSLIVFLLGFTAYIASFVSLAGSSGGDSEAAIGALFLIAMATLFVSLGLGLLLLLLTSIPFPVAMAHFAHEDRLAAAFRFREWWPVLRGNVLGFLIAWLIVGGLLWSVYLASIFAYYTLVLICVLIFLLMPAYFYVLLVGAALYGDLYAEGHASAA